MIHALEQDWQRLTESLNLSPSLAVRDDLIQRYGEPGRFYHNLTHLHHVLATIGSLAAHCREPDLVRLAGWFHDAIYDPRATDNEERSAELAVDRLTLADLDSARIARVEHLILGTKTHQAGDDADAQVLLDADLSILGAAAEEYDRYAAAIRREYAWVPAADYRAGRRQVLERFLNRPEIYFTATGKQRWEARARANLSREAQSLG